MVWWPFGGSAPSSAQDESQSSSGASQTSELLPPTKTTQQAQSLSRDEQAEVELNAFLASLEGITNTKQDTSISQSSKSSSPSTILSAARESLSRPQATSSADASDDKEELDISPAALRPRTMNCRAAFDSAFYCASLGGKFNDIYRFGALQPCSEHWDAFWFCMRTKSFGDQERGDRIAKFYEEREGREKARRSEGRSSEDVWEIRTTPVERAFWKVP